MVCSNRKLLVNTRFDFDILLTTNNKQIIDGAFGGLPVTYDKHPIKKVKIDKKELYKFDKRDTGVLLCIGLFGVYVFSGAMMGAMDFSYFPYLKSADTSFFTISVFVAYFLLCLSPVIIELVEVRRWKALRSKI